MRNTRIVHFRIYNPAVLIEYDLSTFIGEATDHTHLIIRSPDLDDFGPFAALTPSLEEHLRTAPHHQLDRDRRSQRLAIALAIDQDATLRLAARLSTVAAETELLSGRQRL